MRKLHIKLSILLLIALFVGQVHAGLFGGAKVENTITYELLNSDLQIIDSLPTAQSNALLALDAAMRGVKSKKIKKKLGINISGEKIDAIKQVINSLSIKNVVIDNVGATTGAASPFSGLIFMSDEIGRSVQISFVMLISGSASAHDVQVVNLSPSFFGAPNMDVFIVTDETIDASTESTIKNFSSLYKNISTKSLTADSFPSGTKKYVAMVFFKSLIAPNVKVKVKLSNEKTGLEGNSEGNYFQIFEDGWVVAAKPFEGNLLQQNQWMKVTFQSNNKIYPAMSDKEYLVGLFKLGVGN